jgi:hypothetical protein
VDSNAVPPVEVSYHLMSGSTLLAYIYGLYAIYNFYDWQVADFVKFKHTTGRHHGVGNVA